MQRPLPLSRIRSSLASDWNLSSHEVEANQIKFGSNEIIPIKKNLSLQLLKETAMDPMIWFLVGTSLLFTILKSYNQALILLLATIPLIGMDAFLHWRTQASIRSLSMGISPYTTVIRNGVKLHIHTAELVPGDLISVNTGDFFPADGIIVAGENLQIDESALTGEAFPVAKSVLRKLPKNTPEPPINYSHWGFAGTRLLTGHALLRVVYTGKENFYGAIITSTFQSTHTRTPLQNAIARLVFALISIATCICIILAVTRLLQGFGFIDALIGAAILAVAALPDEFPVVFTFFLGLGIYRLAKNRALVRRAVTVENIGRVSCICSDKTGTITEGRLLLVDMIPANNITPEKLLYLAALASRKESGDPLDSAIINKIIKSKISNMKRIQVFPFTEDRKRETALIKLDSAELFYVTKGAPEVILSLCHLSETQHSYWVEQIKKSAASGQKVIACAISHTIDKHNHIEPTADYEFSGLLAFEDPPREGVIDAIESCRDGQIHVLMITGDHPDTAYAIARQIGLGGTKPNVVTAQAINDRLNDGLFLQTIDVIARAMPSQKSTIVNSLKNAGEIVAVTGDGVNDVPALETANIGIVMGGHGTQSAREVADIILLDDNFGTIVNAIAEGRQLFRNLRLSFKYLLMVHMPFVFSAAIIPLLGFPLLYYPIHIVWIELLIHPTCMLVFQDLPTTKKLTPVKKQHKISFFSFNDWTNIISVGTYTTILVTMSFILMLHFTNSITHARTLALAELAFTSAALTIGLSNLRTWVARTISLLSILSAVVLIQAPLIANFLFMQPLTAFDWGIVFISSLVTLGLTKL